MSKAKTTAKKPHERKARKLKPRRAAPVTAGTATAADRDKRGRFRPGNAAAKGRRSKGSRLRDELADVCTPAQFRKVAAAMLGKAQRGDIGAASWVADRLLGRPRVAAPVVADPVDVGSLDGANAVRTALARLATAAASGDLALDAAVPLARVVGALLTGGPHAAFLARLRRPGHRSDRSLTP